MPGVGDATVVLASATGTGVLRIALAPGADSETVTAAARRILRLQFGVRLDTDALEVVEDEVREVPAPVSFLRLVETDADGVIVRGEDIDALLDSLDPGPGPRFDTDVLASAVRHPAGVAVSADGHSRIPSQVSTASTVPDPRPQVATSRVVVEGLSVEPEGLGVRAKVRLSHDGRECVGEAEGAPSPAAQQRTVATATLRALDPLLPVGIRLEIDAVMMQPFGDSTVALVRVIWVTKDGSEHLTGSAEVSDFPRDALIRATLDAVNRRLHLELVDR